jgi:hypothetical protein
MLLRTVVAAVFLLGAGQVAAQDVHKCVRGKEISYQSDPCDAGQTFVKTWNTWPPRASDTDPSLRTPPPVEANPGYLARQARRARNGAGPGTVIGPSAGYSACADMKRARDEYLDSEHGRHTSYDGRRAWNDRVFDACK